MGRSSLHVGFAHGNVVAPGKGFLQQVGDYAAGFLLLSHYFAGFRQMVIRQCFLKKVQIGKVVIKR